MKRLGLVAMAAVIMALQGCGVDGPPERPAAPTTPAKSTVAISGDATMGVQTEL